MLLSRGDNIVENCNIFLNNKKKLSEKLLATFFRDRKIILSA